MSNFPAGAAGDARAPFNQSEPPKERCEDCNGTGFDESVNDECETCGGWGYIVSNESYYSRYDEFDHE